MVIVNQKREHLLSSLRFNPTERSSKNPEMMSDSCKETKNKASNLALMALQEDKRQMDKQNGWSAFAKAGWSKNF